MADLYDRIASLEKQLAFAVRERERIQKDNQRLHKVIEDQQDLIQDVQDEAANFGDRDRIQSLLDDVSALKRIIVQQKIELTTRDKKLLATHQQFIKQLERSRKLESQMRLGKKSVGNTTQEERGDDKVGNDQRLTILQHNKEQSDKRIFLLTKEVARLKEMLQLYEKELKSVAAHHKVRAVFKAAIDRVKVAPAARAILTVEPPQSTSSPKLASSTTPKLDDEDSASVTLPPTCEPLTQVKDVVTKREDAHSTSLRTVAQSLKIIRLSEHATTNRSDDVMKSVPLSESEEVPVVRVPTPPPQSDAPVYSLIIKSNTNNDKAEPTTNDKIENDVVIAENDVVVEDDESNYADSDFVPEEASAKILVPEDGEGIATEVNDEALIAYNAVVVPEKEEEEEKDNRENIKGRENVYPSPPTTKLGGNGLGRLPAKPKTHYLKPKGIVRKNHN